MPKISPEQAEKDHEVSLNKACKLTKLDSLKSALQGQTDSPITTALIALRQLHPGRIPGLRCYATAVYNRLREEWLPDVDLPKLHSEGVIYTGRAEGKDVFVELDEAAGLVLTDAIAGLGEHGRWELRSDGSIMLSCKPGKLSKARVDVVDDAGQRVMECRDAEGTLRMRVGLGHHSIKFASSDEFGFRVHQVPADEEVDAPSPYIETTTKKQRLINAETRISQLESQVTVLNEKLSNLASVLAGQAYYREKTAASQEPHWNTSQTLPPVGCDLLINLPAGSYQFTAQEGRLSMSLDLDERTTFRASRVCHVQTRGNDLTYQLVGEAFNGFQVKGQFSWTYP